MSRHNRRRTRGGHKSNSSNHSSESSFSAPSSVLAVPGAIEPPLLFHSRLPTTAPATKPTPGARHWHNKYIAWQARDRRQREERAKLEAEKRRIFGGDESDNERGTGEDDILCEKMLEYFGGLDFIEP